MNSAIHTRYFAALGFLLLWLSYFGYDLIYRHYHRNSRGNLISHVHFYKDTEEGKNHQHSDEDFFWLDMMSNQTILLPSVPNIEISQIECIQLSQPLISFESVKSISGLYTRPMRGPPFHFSLS